MENSAENARRRDREEIHQALAKELDLSAREFLAAKALAGQALLRLIQAAMRVSRASAAARSEIRGPFVKWCLTACKVFHPAAMKGACNMASRTHKITQPETWQLRMLGVVKTVHHVDRPQVARQTKPISFIGHLTRTKEAVVKLIQQRGGAKNLSEIERQALGRQLGSLDDLRATLRHGG